MDILKCEARNAADMPNFGRGYRANCSELFRTVTGTEVFRTVPFGNTSGTLRNTSVVREHFGTLRNTQKEQNFLFSSFCSSCLARVRNQRSHNSQVQLSRGWCQVPGGTRMMVTSPGGPGRGGGWLDQGSNGRIGHTSEHFGHELFRTVPELFPTGTLRNRPVPVSLRNTSGTLRNRSLDPLVLTRPSPLRPSTTHA